MMPLNGGLGMSNRGDGTLNMHGSNTNESPSNNFRGRITGNRLDGTSNMSMSNKSVVEPDRMGGRQHDGWRSKPQQ